MSYSQAQIETMREEAATKITTALNRAYKKDPESVTLLEEPLIEIEIEVRREREDGESQIEISATYTVADDLDEEFALASGDAWGDAGERYSDIWEDLVLYATEAMLDWYAEALGLVKDDEDDQPDPELEALKDRIREDTEDEIDKRNAEDDAARS